MKNADLGFDKEYVVYTWHLRMNRDYQKRQVFKESLLRHSSIIKVAFGNIPGGSEEQTAPGYFEYKGAEFNINFMMIDPDYFDLLDIKLLYGRNFSWDMQGDFSVAPNSIRKVILNEIAIKEFDIKSPVGDHISYKGGTPIEIIGVVKDFHVRSLHHKIRPYVYLWSEPLEAVSIKILPDNIPGTINYIKEVVESISPDEEKNYRYSFLDETFNKQYEQDEQLARIITNFAIVALIIGCLGLFGLSTFMAARRTKEIGIRKSMGASVQSVFLLLSREFLIWVIISVAIACPVGWFIMDRWLQNFASRTSIS